MDPRCGFVFNVYTAPAHRQQGLVREALATLAQRALHLGERHAGHQLHGHVEQPLGLAHLVPLPVAHVGGQALDGGGVASLQRYAALMLASAIVVAAWPLMQGRVVPEYDASRGFLWASLHDPFLIHFLHRWWAWIAVAFLVVLARKVRVADRRASIAATTGMLSRCDIRGAA